MAQDPWSRSDSNSAARAIAIAQRCCDVREDAAHGRVMPVPGKLATHLVEGPAFDTLAEEPDEEPGAIATAVAVHIQRPVLFVRQCRVRARNVIALGGGADGPRIQRDF